MITKKLFFQAFLICSMLAGPVQAAESLKVHGIFASNMVLQRDKPIKIWGWAPLDSEVAVSASFTDQMLKAKPSGEKGRWEVVFDAQPANTTPQTITVSAVDETIVYDNILIGDIWVMNGQSNMVWRVEKTLDADLEKAQADMPLLRAFKINNNEQSAMQEDINPEVIAYDTGWVVSTPETAKGFSAIGYAFGSNVQRATGVPIGIIDNARGGASLESLVPYRKFREHPLTKGYVEWVDQRAAEFDPDQWLAKRVERWDKQVAKQREDGVAEDKLKEKPTMADMRSWSVPGKSPSDAGSCYNGMFGVFIGYNIKGVLFHQGYNNAMRSNLRPKRYRTMMKLMVDGWREDFNDPTLPVGIIGFCAGDNPQKAYNFESFIRSPAALIREAQRLGLNDVENPESTAFLPAHDIQIPGLHPRKKKEHGVRAARWALKNAYGMDIKWETASLESVEIVNDEVVLTFDKPVYPHDRSGIPQGFAIAGEDGEFYRAYARFRTTSEISIPGGVEKSMDTKVIHVWSPLVEKPASVRYAWARSPLGNLYVDGKPWAPLPSLRTDDWDWPEVEDPAADPSRLPGTVYHKTVAKQAKERNMRRIELEAEMALKIQERLESLGYIEE